MTIGTERPTSQPRQAATRLYVPELLPLLQSLLATLADIDFAHQSEVAAVEASAAGEDVKRAVVAKMRAHHRDRREPYVQQIAILEDRMGAMAV